MTSWRRWPSTLFARLTPMHKERIVTLLKREGTWWALWATASTTRRAARGGYRYLRRRRGGYCPRSGGYHSAGKEPDGAGGGVIEGRRTFANMLKYIKMTASSNFGNVFSVLVASAFLPFLPMLPLHLLIQNLLYDVSQVAIPFDNVDDEQIQKPQRWNPADLGRFMLFFGPISSIFDILTFCLMWWVFHANTPEPRRCSSPAGLWKGCCRKR
jgi:Mg2+-importing ATPase